MLVRRMRAVGFQCSAVGEVDDQARREALRAVGEVLAAGEVENAFDLAFETAQFCLDLLDGLWGGSCFPLEENDMDDRFCCCQERSVSFVCVVPSFAFRAQSSSCGRRLGASPRRS